MSQPAPQPLRIETVLRQLPEVDLLAPLRALMVTTSRAHPADAPFLTVGKRLAQTGRLTEAMPHTVERFSAHLTKLFELSIVSLEAQGRGDLRAAVSALLDASRAETRIGREAAALAWLEHALHLAETADSRDSEIEVLRALGAHQFAAYEYATAGRHFQRCFTLADAEGWLEEAARASLALGAVSAALSAPLGASSWNARALSLAGQSDDIRGRAHLGLSEAHATHGDLAAATKELELAVTLLRPSESANASETSATPLRDGARVDGASSPALVSFDLECPASLALARTEARLALRMHRPEEAIAHFRVALAAALRGVRDARLALIVRIELSRCLLDLDRLADAEDEVRLAEEMAVVHGRTRELSRLYIILGEIRGRQGDADGFVFFEQAIALVRDVVRTPRIKADAYLAYARFRNRFGEEDEATGYIGRARELLTELDDQMALARLDAEWGITSAPR